MINNPTLHQIWLGGNIPEDIYRWMQTIWKVNPEFKYILWDENRLRDQGIDIHQFDKQNGHVCGISGGLRLVILEKYGGIYLDCDVECLKPLYPLLVHDAFTAYQDWSQLGNAVFGCVPHHPWIQWQLEHAIQIQGQDPAWSTHLMDRAPRDGVTVLPKETFYPWRWDTPPPLRHLSESTMAIHHWKGSWG